MNSQAAIKNIFYILDSVEFVLLESESDIDGLSYVVSVGLHFNRVLLILYREDLIPLTRYRLDTIKQSKRTLNMLIKKYGLLARTIAYVYENDTKVEAYTKENVLAYTLTSTTRDSFTNVSYCLHTNVQGINLQRLWDDFDDFLVMLSEQKNLTVRIISSPKSLIRRNKLLEIGVD